MKKVCILQTFLLFCSITNNECTMPEEKLYQIEELPDLKVNWTESYKCLDEPLLEYVWEVANHFLPSCEDTDKGMILIESTAPAIFANRYFERNLTIEERYKRAKEMGMCNTTFEQYVCFHCVSTHF